MQGVLRINMRVARAKQERQDSPRWVADLVFANVGRRTLGMGREADSAELRSGAERGRPDVANQSAAHGQAKMDASASDVAI
jgi:hypothetical protein